MSDEIKNYRLEKLEQLKKDNIDVYGRRFFKKDISSVKEGDTSVKIAGRIMAIRKHGKSSFLDLKDFTGKLQVYFKKDSYTPEENSLLEKLDIGDILGVEGDIFKTRTGETTLLGKSFTMLSKSLQPLPEKWHGLTDIEIRFRKRYLDLIMNQNVKEVFTKRAQILQMIREFLGKKQFIEVETPMMHPIPGGAEAKPFITYHNTLDMELYMRIAPELYLKRLLVGGFEKIYEINRSFRNEGISPLHNPEFTMLELYSAYGDCTEMMELTESLITNLSKSLHNSLTFTFREKNVDLSLPWKKITWDESFKMLGIENWRDIKEVKNKVIEFGLEKDDENGSLFETLDLLFTRKVQPQLINPVFIYEYPKENSPLAKSYLKNPDMTERFELFIGGMEIANAYSELNDPIEQYKRFNSNLDLSKNSHKVVDIDYIEALEYGMPPAGGLGIGIDRLVMLMTDSHSVREVIFFPLLRMKK